MVDGLASVIVPAYDEEQFIGEALDSAFAQDYRPLEVIVVDDGSGDRTVEIAAGYDVKLIRQPNRGPAAARNAGLLAAQGEYIAILDADDVWPEDRCSRLIDAMRSGAGLALGQTEVFLNPGEPAPAHFPHHWQNPVGGHLVGLMAHRSVYEQIGGYDETLRLSEDVDWFMRARDAGVTLARVDRTVTRYRIHADNTSRDWPGGRATSLRVLRASLARRRANTEPSS